MVRIKLSRAGKKKNPFYNIIVSENVGKLKGKYIEKLGYFSYIKNKENLFLDFEKFNSWLGNGAQPSKRIKSIIKKYNKTI